MPVYKVLYNFVGQGEGWTESHLLFSQIATPRGNLDQVAAVAKARVQFCGLPFIINAFRISALLNDDGTKARRASFLYKKEFNQNALGTPALFNAEPDVVALQFRSFVRQDPAIAAYWGNQATTFAGAPQDDAVDNAGNVFPARTNLGAAWPVWAGLLKAGFGWGGAQTIVDTPITGITQDISGQVAFTVAAGTLAPLTLTKKYPVRVRDVNTGQSPLNGPLICTVLNATTLVTREIVAFARNQVGGAIRVYSNVPVFLPYGDIVLDLVTAKHKRFQGFLRHPGRAKARIRG